MAAAHALCTRLGITWPVIQAPMAGVQGHELAAAVSAAGGLGSLPTATFAPQELQRELQALQQACGGRPWAVNFFCHRPAEPQAVQTAEARWREALAPWYRQAGVEAPTAGAAARRPFDEAMADLVAPFRPPVVSFHFGLPAPALLARAKGWGAVVMSSATTVDEARWLEAHGADVVIAQGLEAGGHRGHFLRADDDLSGQAGLFALLPQVAAAVRLPVVAAGGIVDAAAVRAARALGAAGVQAGTVFLPCPEARTAALHRAALAAAQPGVPFDTRITRAFTGRPARGIANRWMLEAAAPGVEGAIPPFPLAAGALTPLRARAESEGRSDFTAMWAGQRRPPGPPRPAAEIVHSLSQGWQDSPIHEETRR